MTWSLKCLRVSELRSLHVQRYSFKDISAEKVLSKLYFSFSVKKRPHKATQLFQQHVPLTSTPSMN